MYLGARAASGRQNPARRAVAVSLTIVLAFGISFFETRQANAADLQPERVTSAPEVDSDLIEFDGLLYFAGLNTASDSALYSFDGTTAVEIPGSAVEPDSFVVYNGALYFTGDDGSQDGIYRYDGTVVERLAINVDSPNLALVFNGLLYFTSFHEGYGELYTFDSAEVPAAAHAVANTPESPQEPFVHDGELYMSGFDSPDGRKVYKAGSTTPMTDTPLMPFYFTEYDNKTYFSAIWPYLGIGHPAGLYFLDGSSFHHFSGVAVDNPYGFLVHDGMLFMLGTVASGTDTGIFFRYDNLLAMIPGSPAAFGSLGSFDGVLYFTEGTPGSSNLASYDGSTFTSYLGSPPSFSSWLVYDGTPYFVSNDRGADKQLWRFAAASGQSGDPGSGSQVGGSLADTGTDGTLLLLTGVGLLLAGLAFVRTRRKSA